MTVSTYQRIDAHFQAMRSLVEQATRQGDMDIIDTVDDEAYNLRLLIEDCYNALEGESR